MSPVGESAAAAGGDSNPTVFLVVGVIWLGFFTWLAVLGWMKHRRKEREAYYLFETEKRLLEGDEAGAMRILRLRREEEQCRWLRRREGLKLGGLITVAMGGGLLFCLPSIDTGDHTIAGVGWIPLAIGLALLAYAYILYPDVADMTGPLSFHSDGGSAEERH